LAVPNEPAARSRSDNLDFVGALKDAALAAFVAFGLFSLMLGLRTETGSTGRLEVFPRPGLLATAVAAVFAGRLLVGLIARSRFTADIARLLQATTPKLEKLGRFAAPALLALALLAPVLFYSNRYLLDLGILVLTYIMLGWGLNIVVGLAGLLDLG
jgi:branched-chain amino acid transport system permease protein